MLVLAVCSVGGAAETEANLRRRWNIPRPMVVVWGGGWWGLGEELCYSYMCVLVCVLDLSSM